MDESAARRYEGLLLNIGSISNFSTLLRFARMRRYFSIGAETRAATGINSGNAFEYCVFVWE
jgi:hypothetical protein